MVSPRFRSVAVVLLLMTLAGLFALLRPGVATADSIILPRDKHGDVVVQMSSDGGGVSGSLNVVNPTASSLTINFETTGAIEQCHFDSAVVPANSTTDIDVKAADCTLDKNGNSVAMTVTGAAVSAVTVLLKPKPASKPVSLNAALIAFVLALGGSLLLIRHCWVTRPDREDVRLHLGDELSGLPDGWKFKESWATNVGAVSAAFVAVFGGTNDAIKALVGDGGETLPGRLLIIAGISALLIGIAPLVLQAIGPKGEATTLGVLVAAWLTTGAVAGQVLAVYTAFGVKDPTGSPWSDFTGGFSVGVPLFVVIVLLLLLVWYVVSSMRVLLTPPPANALPAPSDELLAASATLVAAQICCVEGKPPPPDRKGDLLVAAHIEAVQYLAKVEEAKRAKKALALRAKANRRRTLTTRFALRFDARAARLEAESPQPDFDRDDILAASAGAGRGRSPLL